MATIFSIFFNTKTTFQRIQEKSTTNIDLNNILLFIFSGIFVWTTTYFQDNLDDIDILLEILAFVLSISFSVVFAKYLMNYIFLWISRLLKGSVTKLEIETILAYSLIPKLFTFPLVLYFGLTDSYANFTEIDSLIAMTIDIVTLIFGIKIMLQGLMTYNGFGLIKALITMSPMIILWTAYYFRLIW